MSTDQSQSSSQSNTSWLAENIASAVLWSAGSLVALKCYRAYHCYRDLILEAGALSRELLPSFSVLEDMHSIVKNDSLKRAAPGEEMSQLESQLTKIESKARNVKQALSVFKLEGGSL